MPIGRCKQLLYHEVVLSPLSPTHTHFFGKIISHVVVRLLRAHNTILLYCALGILFEFVCRYFDR